MFSSWGIGRKRLDLRDIREKIAKLEQKHLQTNDPGKRDKIYVEMQKLQRQEIEIAQHLEEFDNQPGLVEEVRNQNQIAMDNLDRLGVALGASQNMRSDQLDEMLQFAINLDRYGKRFNQWIRTSLNAGDLKTIGTCSFKEKGCFVSRMHLDEILGEIGYTLVSEHPQDMKEFALYTKELTKRLTRAKKAALQLEASQTATKRTRDMQTRQNAYAQQQQQPYPQTQPPLPPQQAYPQTPPPRPPPIPPAPPLPPATTPPMPAQGEIDDETQPGLTQVYETQPGLTQV